MPSSVCSVSVASVRKSMSDLLCHEGGPLPAYSAWRLHASSRRGPYGSVHDPPRRSYDVGHTCALALEDALQRGRAPSGGSGPALLRTGRLASAAARAAETAALAE